MCRGRGSRAWCVYVCVRACMVQEDVGSARLEGDIKKRRDLKKEKFFQKERLNSGNKGRGPTFTCRKSGPRGGVSSGPVCGSQPCRSGRPGAWVGAVAAFVCMKSGHLAGESRGVMHQVLPPHPRQRSASALGRKLGWGEDGGVGAGGASS